VLGRCELYLVLTLCAPVLSCGSDVDPRETPAARASNDAASSVSGPPSGTDAAVGVVSADASSSPGASGVPDTVDGVQRDLDLVNVLYIPGDGTPTRVVPRDFRAACDHGTEGWRYSRDLARIELCGATCGKLRADEAARLDVVIGCPAAPLL
jgi:hypothetical protein